MTASACPPLPTSAPPAPSSSFSDSLLLWALGAGLVCLVMLVAIGTCCWCYKRRQQAQQPGAVVEPACIPCAAPSTIVEAARHDFGHRQVATQEPEDPMSPGARPGPGPRMRPAPLALHEMDVRGVASLYSPDAHGLPRRLSMEADGSIKSKQVAYIPGESVELSTIELRANPVFRGATAVLAPSAPPLADMHPPGDDHHGVYSSSAMHTPGPSAPRAPGEPPSPVAAYAGTVAVRGTSMVSAKTMMANRPVSAARAVHVGAAVMASASPQLQAHRAKK